jgi:hypothetical protein
MGGGVSTRERRFERLERSTQFHSFSLAKAAIRSSPDRTSASVDSAIPHWKPKPVQIVQKACPEQFIEGTERRGFDIIDNFPFMPRLSKHSEPFSATC